MKKLVTGALFALPLMIVSLVVWAQVSPPETVEGFMAWLPKLIEAVVAGNWPVIGGIALMMVVVVVRQYGIPKWGLSTDLLPLITVLLGGFAFAGFSLATGVAIGEAFWNGVITALIAAGAWDLVGQYLMKLILGDKFQMPAPKP